jgi:hypothetical protein
MCAHSVNGGWSTAPRQESMGLRTRFLRWQEGLGRTPFDPSETSAASGFRSAKGIARPSLKRDIVPPLHGHDPLGRVTWQSTSDGENLHFR